MTNEEISGSTGLIGRELESKCPRRIPKQLAGSSSSGRTDQRSVTDEARRARSSSTTRGAVGGSRPADAENRKM
jgi:hypothetical protein